jgi:hypothetical protein
MGGALLVGSAGVLFSRGVQAQASPEDRSAPSVEQGAGSATGTQAGPGNDASQNTAGATVQASKVAAAELEFPATTPQHRQFSHPYGAIEFGVGVLALPDAKVCGEAGCDRGDVSLEVDATPLFRASPLFAVGASATLALTPAQDVPQGNQVFPREHSRRYFEAEGVGRYYLTHGRSFELWTGLSLGLVVVSDNFRTKGAPEVALIGGDSANIATEGVSVGLATGATFRLTESLRLGGALRVSNWFLPSTPQRISFYEESSLADRVTMINLALVVAYHGGH